MTEKKKNTVLFVWFINFKWLFFYLYAEKNVQLYSIGKWIKEVYWRISYIYIVDCKCDYIGDYKVIKLQTFSKLQTFYFLISVKFKNEITSCYKACKVIKVITVNFVVF